MKKEDIMFLKQLIDVLEETELKMERAYREKNLEQFNTLKSFLFQIHRKIYEVSQ